MTNLSKSGPVWQSFEDNNVESMLSAHIHQYQRLQPNRKTYQIVAGNGGSYEPQFFGYTRINIWSDGRVEVISEGYDYTGKYNDPVPNPKWKSRDSILDMRWYKAGVHVDDTCTCYTGE